MVKRQYIAILEPSEDGYGIMFPDFPGCVSCGKTLVEALAMGKEALSLHLEGMYADNEVIPIQSNLDKMAEWVKECDGIPHLEYVEVALPSARSVRLNISMPEDVLHQLDSKLAGRKNQRSAFIARAVERQLKDA